MESGILVVGKKEKMTIFEGVAILKKFFNKAEAAGCVLEDYNRLLTEQGDAAIDKFVKATLDLRPSRESYFKHDKTKDGWTLLRDIPFDNRKFELELVEFLKSGEPYVDYEVMKQRAEELSANLGQGCAEHLLDHQDLIPRECQVKYLVFPGTVWRGPHGRCRVPCLYWSGVSWSLNFRWLGDVWSSRAQLIRPRG